MYYAGAGVFVNVLDNQRQSKDWPRLEWEDKPADDIERGARKIVIAELEVAFLFDANGRLIGALNYKE